MPAVATIAQLAERAFRKRQVVGSNPTGGSSTLACLSELPSREAKIVRLKSGVTELPAFYVRASADSTVVAGTTLVRLVANQH